MFSKLFASEFIVLCRSEYKTRLKEKFQEVIFVFKLVRMSTNFSILKSVLGLNSQRTANLHFVAYCYKSCVI